MKNSDGLPQFISVGCLTHSLSHQTIHSCKDGCVRVRRCHNNASPDARRGNVTQWAFTGLSLLNGLDSVSMSRIIIWIRNHWKRLMYSPIVEGLDTGAVGSG